MIEYLYYVLFILLCGHLLITVVIFVVLQRKVSSEQLAVSGERLLEPKVAVLIAARNEEENIIRCLEALVAQDYPVSKLQILVGDDASDDKTASLVKAFAVQHPQIELHHIEPSSHNNLKGKPNVLAQLFKKTDAAFCFITDADIAVNPQWISGMLADVQEQHIDAASGTTFVTHHTTFHVFQTIEWMEALSFIYTADQLGMQVTAVGNNMLISKASYEAVGGYEAIPFSVTEDLDLYLALKKKNYQHRILLSPQSLAWTEPMDTVMQLFRQRKRWMRGVSRTPLICQFYLSLDAGFGFFILFAAFYCLPLAAGLYVTSLLMRSLRMMLMCRATNIKFNPKWIVSLLLLELYHMFFTVGLLVYLALPTGVEWKKRKYV